MCCALQKKSIIHYKPPWKDEVYLRFSHGGDQIFDRIVQVKF